VAPPPGDTISSVHDAANRRIGRIPKGTLTRGWLSQRLLAPVAELDGSGAVVSRFVYATHVNVPDYLVKGGQTYRLVLDQLGSVRLVVNTSDGTVAQRLDYDEYGRVTQNTNPGFQPFGYAGGLLDDATGLVRFGARDYDPVIGRWTAKDPGGFSGGANLYAYAVNDPVNVSDVSGNIPIPIVTGLIGAGISAAVNVYSQVALNGGFDNFSFRELGVATGVGFVAGAAAPFVAVDALGAALLGGVANGSQHLLTNAVNGQASSAGSFTLSVGLGAGGGLIGGAFARSRFLVDESSEALWEFARRNGLGGPARYNHLETINANVTLGNLLRGLFGSLFGAYPVGSSAQYCPLP
jgi:RHS repeat-associated protein